MTSRPILGESKPIKDMIKMINRVATTNASVLVIGESGTGKELVARMIHESGPLKGKPFVPVNCGAIPENLIESEMFGHKKGSFTGAVSDKPGLFEAANNGTLFLDEVGELPLGMQVKLLRAIQERVFRRVGGNDDVKVELRIIAATNRDLESAAKAGTFREDLYYRLNVIQIKTPALKDRPKDIPLLATHFLAKFAAKQKKTIQEFSPEAMAALVGHSWPGNVRELENVVERAVTLSNEGAIHVSSLPHQIAEQAAAEGGGAANPLAAGSSGEVLMGGEIRIPSPDFTTGPVDLDTILGGIEKTYLLKALEQSGGVKKKAAEMLGITFRSIRYRLAKLGLDTDQTE